MRWLGVPAAVLLVGWCDASNASSPGAPLSGSYCTVFDDDEDPLSEGGAWIHDGVYWTQLFTEGGVAFTPQTGSGGPGGTGYDDAYAYLGGFGDDHGGEATVYVSPSANLGCSKEVEILLRWDDDVEMARGYEVVFSLDSQSVRIVKWLGGYGSFALVGPYAPVQIHDGDVVGATIVGDTIAAFVAGQQVLSVDIARDNPVGSGAPYATGSPGLGLFRRSCGTVQDTGATAYAAQDMVDLGAIGVLDGLGSCTDSDGDGLWDPFETGTGTFVSAIDTGTDPLVIDSDGDGLDDGSEVSAGTDPNDPLSPAPPNPVPALGPLGRTGLSALVVVLGVWSARRRRLAGPSTRVARGRSAEAIDAADERRLDA
jgi:hypothetical protein